MLRVRDRKFLVAFDDREVLVVIERRFVGLEVVTAHRPLPSHKRIYLKSQ